MRLWEKAGSGYYTYLRRIRKEGTEVEVEDHINNNNESGLANKYQLDVTQIIRNLMINIRREAIL